MATVLQGNVPSTDIAQSLLILNKVIETGNYTVTSGDNYKLWMVDNKKVAKYQKNYLLVFNIDQDVADNWLNMESV